LSRGGPAAARIEDDQKTSVVADARKSPAALGGHYVSVIAWIVLGAFAGYFAGSLVAGHERLGIVGHIVLGIVGGLVGGFVDAVLFDAHPIDGALDVRSVATAVLGAVVVVVLVGLATGRDRMGRGPI
jgi:uncharacterized membrane protein YeaQ/YmgE (transglycosylase-associated protein family)